MEQNKDDNIEITFMQNLKHGKYFLNDTFSNLSLIQSPYPGHFYTGAAQCPHHSINMYDTQIVQYWK